MADQDSSRGQPETPTATIPAAAPAAPASSLQQPQDLTSRVASANSPAAIRALVEANKAAMEQTLRTKPREFNGKEKAPATPVETPAAEVAPAAEETPAAETPAEETPAAETEQADETETEEDDGGDGSVAPITGKRAHLRIPENDKVGRQALAFMKRNRDMTMEQAMEKARDHLGIKAEKNAAEPEQPVGSPDLPQSIEELDAKSDDLLSQHDKALTELRFEDAGKLLRDIRKMDKHRVALERQGERKQAETANQLHRQFEASEARAIELYEFAGKPDSEGAKRMIEIEEALKENDDPLFHSPDKPLRIAQMVAAELKIAPRKKGTPPAPAAKAAVPAVPAPKKGMLPSGGSRTTPPPINQPPPLVAEVSKVRSIADLRATYAKLGIKTL